MGSRIVINVGRSLVTVEIAVEKTVEERWPEKYPEN